MGANVRLPAAPVRGPSVEATDWHSTTVSGKRKSRSELGAQEVPARKTVWRWSALYCRGAPVGSEAPGGGALGADVDRLLSRRRDVPLWSRLARCEVSFGM